MRAWYLDVSFLARPEDRRLVGSDASSTLLDRRAMVELESSVELGPRDVAWVDLREAP